MPRPPLSVTIITLNEAANIGRAIDSVAWADEVLVVDSGSIDGTPEIARQKGARVVHNAWPGYGQQKNFAQAQAAHDWVFNLDADEVASPALRAEIQAALESADALGIRGWRLPRKTFYWEQWIRHGGWYPNLQNRIANRRYARWTEPPVHEELKIEGASGELREAILHYSFPSIGHQVRTNLNFAELGARQLMQAGKPFSLFKLLWKPPGKFLETYLLKRGFMDGMAGFIISINAAYSMFLKYAFRYEMEK